MASITMPLSNGLPELHPLRFDRTESAAIKEHLTEHGYAVVKDAATPDELTVARSMLWKELGEKYGWVEDRPETWTDEAYEVGGDPRSGLIDMVHSDTFWYCRSLPGVLSGFASCYGTDDLVTAYDRMAINRPVECEEASVADLAADTAANPLMGIRGLHTHFDQDGFGPDVLICYAIMPLYDMDASTGATAIAPGSHLKVPEISRYRQEHQEEMKDESDPARFLKPFTAAGLQAGPVSGKAGDLIVFDTALFHCGCPALSPFGGKLLRAVCIMSMAPRLLLSPSTIKARQLYYELGQGTGGSVLGRLGEAGAQKVLADYAEAEANGTAKPKVRSFADASPEVKKIVGDNLDFEGAPPQSRFYGGAKL